MHKVIWGRLKEWIRKIELTQDEKKQMLLALSVSVVLGGILLITDNAPLKDSLLRNTFEKGVKEESLLVTMGNHIEEEEITLHISELKYTQERIEEVKDQVWEKVIDTILIDQESLEEIRECINLPESIEGYPFTITWEWSPRDLINSKGQVQEEYVDEDGAVLTLNGTLNYEGYEYSYQQGVHIYPRLLSEEEKLWVELNDFIKMADVSNGTKEEFLLPTEVYGETVV